MANKKPEYIYILTNPSKREDWVKIGKSCHPLLSSVLLCQKSTEMTLVPTKV